MRIPGPALLMALFLTGCAAPPALTAASFAADVVSYVVTSKSPTDHAISAVVHEDCALFRVVKRVDVCDPDGEVLVELVRYDPTEADWADPDDLLLRDRAEATFQGPAREVATIDSLR